jgi:hypothetical protein
MNNLLKDADGEGNLLSVSPGLLEENQNLRKKEDILKILEGKAIPVTGRGGPYGSETSRLPHLLDNRRTDGGEVVSLIRRPPLTPGRFLVFIYVRDCVYPTDIVLLERLN